jgi:two-component system sensor histidine kinase YesM
VTQPIHQVVTTMERAKEGHLTPVTMKSGNREIASLKEGYNVMVDEINVLFDRVVDEQEQIRKSELSLLHSQIKPHFLYNTFDAISSLALMNKNKEVYEAILALGSLYRTNLSKGNEVISIGEEIGAVENYIKILKIRYDDIFAADIEVDARVRDMLIPKLTLQPIVENALYHGIKPKGEKGSIRIKAALEGANVVICIADDGVGMSREKVDKIMAGDSQSFGVRGTIERLRIFYMRTDVMRIETEVGKGTVVTITIPAVTEEMKHG